MKNSTIEICLLARTGSRAYNFALPDSDYDQRGFGIQTDINRILGLERPRDYQSGTVDGYIWDITKFTRLAAKCNTNALDILFAVPENILQDSDIGNIYRNARSKFLSTHYLYQVLKGYAYQEYLKTTGQKKQGDLGTSRRKNIEKFGYSGKNAHHCLRLLLVGIHTFKTGIFKTAWSGDEPDWQLLMDLKTHKCSLERFTEAYYEIIQRFESAAIQSILPDDPDWDTINNILVYALSKKVIAHFPNITF